MTSGHVRFKKSQSLFFMKFSDYLCLTILIGKQRVRMRNKSFKILVCLLVFFISINLIIQIDNNSNLASRAKKCIWSFSQQIYTLTPGKVHRYPYKYTTNVKLNKSPNDRNTTLIALVTSGGGNFERRMAIRKTWANNQLFPGLETVFIMGKSVNETINEKLINESRIYGDIVQEDYIDTYWNLTIKTVTNICEV